MVGCPNLFLGDFSEDHFGRPERFFVACIRKYGTSDEMVRLFVVNFLCHAFGFLSALRSRFSEKVVMVDDQSPVNLSQCLLECFVSSLPYLSARHLAVLREAIGNSDATLAQGERHLRKHNHFTSLGKRPAQKSLPPIVRLSLFEKAILDQNQVMNLSIDCKTEFARQRPA
jgi:hypothetical protein